MRKNNVLITCGVLLALTLSLFVAILIYTVSNQNSDIQLAEFETVATSNGRVRGRLEHTIYDKKPFYAFRGIPYAKPPLSELRFKPPVRPDSWNGIRNAFNFGNVCIQISGTGSEDCLFVNVYTPRVRPDAQKLLPVLVAIHGGSFYEGASDEFRPDFLLNQNDVIIVSLNYRLGPFGFLSLNTSQFSGNMGLKDQLLAIKWTNENIHNFGGDRFQITLYGLSAGSASVHLHVLSPASKGLFQRAILVSGSVHCPWAVSQESQIPGLLNFAASMGQSDLSLDQLIEYLQDVDPQLLALRTNRPLFVTGTNHKEFSVFYAPVIEPILTSDPFLLESPMTTLESDEFVSYVDTMFSVAHGESYIFIDPEMRDPVLLEAFDQLMEIQLPLYEMNNNLNYGTEIYKDIAQRIRQHYFGSEGVIGRSTMEMYSSLISDVAFSYGIDRSVKQHAEKSSAKTYYYRFSADTIFNLVKRVTVADTYGLIGATHADEYSYTFGAVESRHDFYNSVPIDSIERRLVNQISLFYTNFMIYGNPTPGNIPIDFQPVRSGDNIFLDIGTDYMSKSFSNNNSVLFWDHLFTEFKMW